MTVPLRFLAALAGLLLSLLPAAAVAAPVMPDGCGDLDLADQRAVFERGAAVDHVFVGRVDNVIPNVLPGGASETSRHRVFVQVLLAGNLPTGQYAAVVFVPTDLVADRKLRVGARYIFFADGNRANLQADGCTGWVPATGLDTDALARLRSDLAVPAPPDEPAESAIGDPPGDADDTPDLGRLVAPGGAISLIGVLGLVLLSRLGRQRP